MECRCLRRFRMGLTCLAATVVFAHFAWAAEDLTALMARHKPPYVRPIDPPDPAITFERVDVLIEPGFWNTQAPYLSIARDGSYAYILEATERAGKPVPGASLVERMPQKRLAQLQQLLVATQWLEAPGGEGPAVHTDADRMSIAVTQEAKTRTVILNGARPAPFAALQTFICDLAFQEHLYYRLTYVEEERRSALRDLHGQIESALALPGRMPLNRDINFERYCDLFAGTLEEWHRSETDELIAAVDLMLLLKRDALAPAVGRLRYDRDLHLRTAVARALPALMQREAIPLLAEMIVSTEQAGRSLMQLGEEAVPTIVAIIKPGVTARDLRSVKLVRAYLDHWEEVPLPIDQRIVDATRQVVDNRTDGSWGDYYREFLSKAEAVVRTAPGSRGR